MRTYLVTYAQSETKVHAKFWESVLRFQKCNDAEVLVIAGRYKNPTRKTEDDGEWWDEAVTPFVVNGRRRLCPNLVVYGDVLIQPTASHPLTGFEVFVGKNSGIFGHTKRALEVVPTGTRRPRVLWSTSACTVANYSASKAGAKGAENHVIGAVVVEVDDAGLYLVRHVSAARDGSFTDLSTKYTPSGVYEAPPATSIVLGDYHAGREDEDVLEATERLVQEVRPKNIVLHDLLDFDARNHHHARSRRERYKRRFDTVESEVRHAVASIWRVHGWLTSAIIRVVRSNHDEAFDKWLETADIEADPVNAPYYHEMWARAYREGFPDAFAAEAERLGVPKGTHFLGVDESLVIQDVEHGRHGHLGVNGSRGTPRAYAKLGSKVSTGHTHVARISDGAFTSGVSAQLDHGYNHLPSGWIHAHILQYADGKRTIVIIVRGKYKGDDE